MSVRPPPSMTVTLASAGIGRVPLETRSMMLPCTITFRASVSFSALPSKMRTFLNRVNPTFAAAVAALAPPGLVGGDESVGDGGVGTAPVAAPPVPGPEGSADRAQPMRSTSAAAALRNPTSLRLEATSAGSVVLERQPTQVT